MNDEQRQSLAAQQQASNNEQVATNKELEGFIAQFEAACWRGDPARLETAHTATVEAFVRHIDAMQANIMLAKRLHGI